MDLGALLCELEACCKDARHVFDEALTHFLDDAVLHFNRAIALEYLGRFEDAEQSYQRCLETDPTHRQKISINLLRDDDVQVVRVNVFQSEPRPLSQQQSD